MARITEFPERDDLPTEEEVERYKYLAPSLESLYDEFSKLSAKKQDAVVGTYKIKMINRVLEETKTLFPDDPALVDLDILDEDELPENSDVVLLLGQFRAALARFEDAFLVWEPGGARKRWITQEDPPAHLLDDEDEEGDLDE